MKGCRGCIPGQEETDLIVDFLISRRSELGGIGHFVGESGHAAQDVVDGIFTLPASNGDVAQVGDVLMEVCEEC